MYVHCANPVSVIILSGSLEPTGKSRGDDTELKKVSKCICGMILYSSDYRWCLHVIHMYIHVDVYHAFSVTHLLASTELKLCGEVVCTNAVVSSISYVCTLILYSTHLACLMTYSTWHRKLTQICRFLRLSVAGICRELRSEPWVFLTDSVSAWKWWETWWKFQTSAKWKIMQRELLTNPLDNDVLSAWMMS